MAGAFRSIRVSTRSTWSRGTNGNCGPRCVFAFLGGPGYYTAYFDHNSTTIRSLGVGARTDVAVDLFRPVSATVAARGAWVPRIRGQSYAPSAVMIGFRFETGG
jgi:hypothetical protein